MLSLTFEQHLFFSGFFPIKLSNEKITDNWLTRNDEPIRMQKKFLIETNKVAKAKIDYSSNYV
jgi:hypothetical protein